MASIKPSKPKRRRLSAPAILTSGPTTQRPREPVVGPPPLPRDQHLFYCLFCVELNSLHHLNSTVWNRVEKIAPNGTLQEHPKGFGEDGLEQLSESLVEIWNWIGRSFTNCLSSIEIQSGYITHKPSELTFRLLGIVVCADDCVQVDALPVTKAPALALALVAQVWQWLCEQSDFDEIVSKPPRPWIIFVCDDHEETMSLARALVEWGRDVPTKPDWHLQLATLTDQVTRAHQIDQIDHGQQIVLGTLSSIVAMGLENEKFRKDLSTVRCVWYNDHQMDFNNRIWQNPLRLQLLELLPRNIKHVFTGGVKSKVTQLSPIPTDPTQMI